MDVDAIQWRSAAKAFGHVVEGPAGSAVARWWLVCAWKVRGRSRLSVHCSGGGGSLPWQASFVTSV